MHSSRHCSKELSIICTHRRSVALPAYHVDGIHLGEAESSLFGQLQRLATLHVARVQAGARQLAAAGGQALSGIQCIYRDALMLLSIYFLFFLAVTHCGISAHLSAAQLGFGIKTQRQLKMYADDIKF